jgi:hypothetical protein
MGPLAVVLPRLYLVLSVKPSTVDNVCYRFAHSSRNNAYIMHHASFE